MEPITALTIIVSLQIIFNVILAISNDNLKSKINKQQEQIDKLLMLNQKQDVINLGLLDVDKCIATKVVDIEKRVDELSK